MLHRQLSLYPSGWDQFQRGLIMPMACVQRYRFRTWARPVQRQWHIFRLPGCGFTGSKLWFLAGIHYVHRPAGGLGSGHQLGRNRGDQATSSGAKLSDALGGGSMSCASFGHTTGIPVDTRIPEALVCCCLYMGEATGKSIPRIYLRWLRRVMSTRELAYQSSLAVSSWMASTI